MREKLSSMVGSLWGDRVSLQRFDFDIQTEIAKNEAKTGVRRRAKEKGAKRN